MRVLEPDSTAPPSADGRLSDAELAPIGDAARATLRALLDSEGLTDVQADALVERRGPSLHITLVPGARIDAMLASTASVRALAAARGLDPGSLVIDVAVCQPCQQR